MTHIRPFRVDDTEPVVRLWQDCGLTRPWNDPYRDIERKLAVQPDLFLMADDDGEIVGSVMAGYEGHRGWINYLAVSPTHRRQGLGRQLMAHAESLLLDLGCPKINLQIRADNAAAVEFYRALGFEPDGSISMGKRVIPDQPGD